MENKDKEIAEQNNSIVANLNSISKTNKEIVLMLQVLVSEIRKQNKIDTQTALPIQIEGKSTTKKTELVKAPTKPYNSFEVIKRGFMIERLKKEHELSSKQIMAVLNQSSQATCSLMKKMESEGIVKFRTGKKRMKIFSLTEKGANQ